MHEHSGSTAFERAGLDPHTGRADSGQPGPHAQAQSCASHKKNDPGNAETFAGAVARQRKPARRFVDFVISDEQSSDFGGKMYARRLLSSDPAVVSAPPSRRAVRIRYRSVNHQFLCRDRAGRYHGRSSEGGEGQGCSDESRLSFGCLGRASSGRSSATGRGHGRPSSLDLTNRLRFWLCGAGTGSLSSACRAARPSSPFVGATERSNDRPGRAPRSSSTLGGAS